MLMEQKVFNKSPMVSRLPKFGARPVNSTPSSLPNGKPQTVVIQEGKNPPSKPNGVVKASSFSMKWRKENGEPVDPPNPSEASVPEETKQPYTQQSPLSRELKSPCTPVNKVRRSASSLATGSPKSTTKSTKSTPSPKQKPSNSQSLTTSKSQDLLDQKSTHNGTLSLGASPCHTRSSGLQRPRTYSAYSRSNSNDSLARQSLVSDYMVRSQSFTHFKLPSPTSSPITRSFSFNKAVELAKPLTNTQLRPPRSFGIKSPMSFGKGRPILVLGSHGFGKGFTDPLPAGTLTGESLTPPSSLRRQPNCLTKPSLQAFKLNGGKQQCPVGTDVITPPPTPGLLHCDTKHVSTSYDSPEESLTEPGLNEKGHYNGEGAEDMSLSSASSLERNDLTEDLFDDFENLADQSVNGSLHSKNPVATPSQRCMQSFLNETMDWPGIGLMGGKTECRSVSLHGTSIMSPDADRHAPSSLELSPSNSSGGTYMWDEEGMETLGNNHHMHCCSSYESDLNSIEILNNLENTGSGDLEEDDLMLDVDLSEDGTFLNAFGSQEGLRLFPVTGEKTLPKACADPADNTSTSSPSLLKAPWLWDLQLSVRVCVSSDGMAHFEHSERGGRPGQWRRRQPRWGGTDHVHNDNRFAGFHYDVYRQGHRLLHPAVQHVSHTGALDELTLKHMAEDCSSVKSQLLKLKNLLQMEDDEITPESLDSSEDDRRAQQMEELMKEVAHLREELKSKDKIITRLTHQQHQESTMRCHCQQQKSGVRGERRTHHDKSTQTVWRPPHHHPAAVATPPLSPWQCQYQSTPRASLPQRRQSFGKYKISIVECFRDVQVDFHFNEGDEEEMWCEGDESVLVSHCTGFTTTAIALSVFVWMAMLRALFTGVFAQGCWKHVAVQQCASNTSAHQMHPQRTPHPEKSSKNSPNRGPQ
ncbi:hypothetical protein DNTS_011821 [Danionella cerebrum]|uniref:Serine-rich coiled-coil domain-containing protein 2 n=1 Tax=Danionella cerebrum TaxID=2873325 RepID=A0A553R2B2_9TELE|nr:hypothetical protein DNTS_011821 [Danionella translucida]